MEYIAFSCIISGIIKNVMYTYIFNNTYVFLSIKKLITICY